ASCASARPGLGRGARNLRRRNSAGRVVGPASEGRRLRATIGASMAEPQFREIQLSGKQLVFLFMTAVVLAVAVFLLGVSVGRGTRTPGDAVVEQTAEVVPPADLPPPTEITPADLQYYDALKE